MATTKVQIANYALKLLGAARIDDFTDNTEEARLVKEFYTIVLEEFLTEHAWSFAIRRVALGQTANTPAFGFTYEYQLPSDCLRILDANTEYDYAIEEDKLLTDATSVSIKYITTPDVEDFSPKFVAALAAKMAFLMSYALTKSNTTAERIEKIYIREFALARNYDSQQSRLKRVEYSSDEWLNARY